MSDESMINFTPRAAQVLGFAREEAERLHHEFVDSGHLLLGLLRLGQGVAFRVLLSRGVELESARRELQQLVVGGTERRPSRILPYTPRLKRVLALAGKEAKAMSHGYLGTEHILLGLLREVEGLGARLLQHFQVDAAATRADVLKELSSFSADLEEKLDLAEAIEAAMNPPDPAPRKEGFLRRFWRNLTTPLPSGDVSTLQNETTDLPHQSPWGSYFQRADESMSNFTPRACQVLALARKQADRFHHNFVGTEHLLLGLLSLGQGVGINVLQKMGLDLDSVRLEVEKQIGVGPDQKQIHGIPFTPRGKEVLALACKEAKALHHTYVGTEHILLGLLREGEGVAVRVLKSFDIGIEEVRMEILKELDPNLAAREEASRPGHPASVQAVAYSGGQPVHEHLSLASQWGEEIKPASATTIVHPMKLGIINSAFQQVGMDTVTGLKHIKRIGFDTVDIFTEAMGIAPEEVTRVAQTCERLGLPVVSLPVVSVGLVDFNDPVREFHVERTKKFIDLAKTWGAKNVLLVLGEYIWQREVIPAKLQWHWGIETCHRLGDYADKQGVDIALELEPFRLSLLNSVDAMARFVDECNHPRVRANIDISHLVLSDTSPGDVAKLKGRAIHVHLSDCDGKVHGDLPPGRGVVKFAPYLQAIKELEMRDAVVSIELEYSPEPERIVEWVEEAYRETAKLMTLAGLRG